MKAHSIIAAFVAVALSLARPSQAADGTGTVREVSGSTITVETAGGAAPIAGDEAEIFFKLAGVDEEISVAQGTVLSSEGVLAKVKIDNATGEVAKDQLVRFKAGKGPRPSATAAPTPAAPAPSGARGYLGVRISDGPSEGSGALVVEANTDSPAARADIRPNDLIVALDGTPVENAGQLSERTAALAPGSRHDFLVSRGGKLLKLGVTLGELPANQPGDAVTSAPPAATPSATLPPSVPFPTAAPETSSAAAPAPSGSAEDAIAMPYAMRGNAQYAAGNIDGAIASYTEGIRAAPSVGVLYLNRANAYLYKPNFKASIADASKALQLKGAKEDDAYVVRGTAKAGLGDYASAIADCNRALKINPKHALAYNNRANNKLRQGNYKGALADCNKSIALDSNSALPYYNRGFVYVNTGNPAGALSDWKKAVAMQPSFAAELNPKIAQLEAQGVRPKQKKPPQSSTGPGPGDWVDLTNAPQKMIGSWKGGRHVTQYFADGTFVTDPHLVPNPPRGQWQVQGDRLVQYYPQAGTTTTHNILSISGQELVLRDPQGNTFRLRKSK